MKLLVVFAVSGLAVLVACSEGMPASAAMSTSGGAAPVSTGLPPNDAEQHPQGISILGSTAGESEDGAIAQSFTPIGDKRYSGTVAVTGSFVMRNLGEDEDYFRTCFWVDGPDAEKIPRPRGDDRDTWFCLRDEDTTRVPAGFGVQDEILSQMKGGDCEISGEAAIEIKDYARDGDCECDDNDRATLVRVVHAPEKFDMECGVNERDENAP